MKNQHVDAGGSNMYNEILSKHEDGSLRNSILATNGDINDFYVAGRYRPIDAKRWFSQRGITDVDTNSEADVKRWFKENKSDVLDSNITNAQNKKESYENRVSDQPVQTYQRGVVTHPGVIMGISDTEINEMEIIADPNSATITMADGSTTFNPAVSNYLMQVVFEDMRTKQGGGQITMLENGKWSVDGYANNLILSGYDIEQLKADYKNKTGQEMEDDDAETLKAFAENPSAYNMTFSTNQSPTFNAKMNKKLYDSNEQKANQGTLTSTDVFTETSMNNRDGIKKLENHLGDVLFYENNPDAPHVSTVEPNIPIVVPVYENGVGKVGNMNVVVQSVTPAVNNNGERMVDFDGRFMYNYNIILPDGSVETYPASTTEDFISQISAVR